MDFSKLPDELILNTLLSIDKFEDLDNMCKSSSRIQELCKEYRLQICKSVLQNLGYRNLSGLTDSPCALMLLVRTGLPKKLTKQTFNDLSFSKKEDKNKLARLLAINNKVKVDWLYDIAVDLIQENEYEKFKQFCDLTDYRFALPKKTFQNLLSIAGEWAESFEDPRIFKYMLEHGAKLDDLDYSEDWKSFSDYRSKVSKDNGLSVRELLRHVKYGPVKELVR
jgi:hypothetical protein